MNICIKCICVYWQSSKKDYRLLRYHRDACFCFKIMSTFEMSFVDDEYHVLVNVLFT